MLIGAAGGSPGAAGFRRPCPGCSCLAWRRGRCCRCGTGCTAVAAVRPTARRRSDAEMIWKRAGSPDMRHPVDVIRTIDGDTFEARVHLPPGLDLITRVRLRGIDAPELKASCAQELQMAEAATDALRDLLGEGEVSDLQYRAGQICRAASSPTSRPGAPAMFRRRCSPPVMPAATAAATAAAGARMRQALLRNEKAARSRGFCVFNPDPWISASPITVVPTETR